MLTEKHDHENHLVRSIFYLSMYKLLPKLYKKYEKEILYIDILIKSEFFVQIL